MTAATVIEWRPLSSGAMIGLLTVALPSGMTIHGCAVFQKAGRRWVAPPGRPRLRQGAVARGVDGRPAYDPVISFADRARQDAWSEMALQALDEYLAGGAR